MMISEFKGASKRKEVQSNENKPGKLLRCPQEGCGKVFRSSPGYRYHLKSHDLDPRPHVCQCCHKKFKSANGLKYHLRKAHHIEPVLSKQNLGPSSPKSRESISSEEDPYLNLNDSYSRNFMNGSNLPPPLVKSPLGLSSPLLKNLPGIPSPLIKGPMDTGPYYGGGSTSSTLQSPYGNKDRYSGYYEKHNSNENSLRNGDFSRKHEFSRPSSSEFSSYSNRSSLSEYTQQCQQANNQLRQQVQRLSTGDLSNPHLPATDSLPGQQRSSCQFYSCSKNEDYAPNLNNTINNNSTYSHDYRRTSSYTCVSTDKLLNGMRGYHMRDTLTSGQYNNKEYPGDISYSTSSCRTGYPSNHGVTFSLPYNNNNNIKEESTCEVRTSNSNHFKAPNSVQNSEQIVPDISCSSPPNPSCDSNNNTAPATSAPVKKTQRTNSESSNETELSDCVFQNENSNPPFSSPTSCSNGATEMITLSSTIKKEEHGSCGSNDVILSSPSAEPLYCRRTSRTKSILPALVINPSSTALTSTAVGLKPKDLSKLDPASRLRYLAEVAVTSPRSPFHQSPLPLTLTPSMLPGEGTPDWIKSPSKFPFPDKASFLLTPTVSRVTAETSHTDSLITSSNVSLPASPFLENIQTPSFWPTQMWPTPIWLCFLKGCTVKFEKDDTDFMTTEDVAMFCTTPGGRRRDDMNFYTSGMKIVKIKEKPSIHSARDMVELTFEQVIPGTQRLVAKCPIDHPFYVKHKGWSASNTTEAMARYGTPFRTLQRNDTVISHSSKSNLTPAPAPSPRMSTAGPQVFTFSVQDTSRFSLQKKSDCLMPPPAALPAAVRDEKTVLMTTTTPSSSSSTSTASTNQIDSTRNDNKHLETITLTYSAKSPPQNTSSGYPLKPSISHLRLANELKSISEGMKRKAAAQEASNSKKSKATNDKVDLIDDKSEDGTLFAQQEMKDGDLSKKNKKKRRKPLLGNEKDRRPMNGFMLFAKEMRVELTKLCPGKDNRAISKLLGERWRELSEDKREDYSRMAKEMADERMKVNPDCWKRKHRKDKENATSCSSNKSTSSSADNESPESKKIRLASPDKELILPAAFVESGSNIATSSDTKLSVADHTDQENSNASSTFNVE